MIITSSTLAMASTSMHTSTTSTEVSVRRWGGGQPQATPARQDAPHRPSVARHDLRQPGGHGHVQGHGQGHGHVHGHGHAAGHSPGAGHPGGADGDTAPGAVDAAAGRFSTLIALIERFTGQKVEVLRAEDVTPGRAKGPAAEAAPDGSGPAAPAPPPAARPAAGQEITVSSTTVEREGTAVSAAGSVTTADGRHIDVALDLALYRESARSTTLRMTSGAPEPKDPLALGFNATPALSGERAPVDLDGDGAAESVPLLGDGLAYLALDRDGDGRVTNGTELFGPSSGDGFDELAGYDQDRNGWIDAADPVFARLRLWNGNDSPLQTLAERGVGAIALTDVASPYRLEANGETLGRLGSTGVWLGEDGSAGAVYQMDVVT